jgi:hypothetical protein
MKRWACKWVLAGLLVAGLAAPAGMRADVVRLKDGRILEAEVVRSENGWTVLQTEEAKMVLPADSILSVQPGAQVASLAQPAAKPDAPSQPAAQTKPPRLDNASLARECYLRALQSLADGADAAAERDLIAACHLNPDNPKPWRQLLNLQFGHLGHDQASFLRFKDTATQLLSLDPKNAEAKRLLAQARDKEAAREKTISRLLGEIDAAHAAKQLNKELLDTIARARTYGPEPEAQKHLAQVEAETRRALGLPDPQLQKATEPQEAEIVIKLTGLQPMSRESAARRAQALKASQSMKARSVSSSSSRYKYPSTSSPSKSSTSSRSRTSSG